MKVKLISNDMWSPALEFTVDQFPRVIGRNGKSDIQFDDRWMSAQQCELNVLDGQLEVRDLRSRHGTLVNGRRVRRSMLKCGDTLTVGIRSFRISYRRSRPKTEASKTKSRSNLYADSEEITAAAG